MIFQLILIVFVSSPAVIECWNLEVSWIVGGQKTCVPAHNEYRRKHNVPDLKASWTLSLAAKRCLESMIKKSQAPAGHPCHPGNDGHGENIYTRWEKQPLGPVYKDFFSMAIDLWYDEITLIDFSPADWYMTLPTSLNIGHFTQVVWKSTTHVGCAGASYINQGLRTYLILCRYSPPGNQFNSRSIRENIIPLPQKPKVSKPCFDKLPEYCSYYKDDMHTACTTNDFKALIQESCKKSCNLC